jgi:anaerobic ribonucleoside-triphosphate reductase activating protein
MTVKAATSPVAEPASTGYEPAGGLLNVAAVCRRTHALGPGLRAVVWVQGCPLSCTGCMAPDWIPVQPTHLVDPAELAVALLADPDIDGLTFSGGEPMMQAAALTRLVRAARRIRPASLVCFTGFELERLRRRPPTAGVTDLLSEIDVLIDGPYVAARNDGRGLRGSDNQRIHHLTARLAGHDLATGPRAVEIRLTGRGALAVGVPPRGLLPVVDAALTSRRGRRPDKHPDLTARPKEARDERQQDDHR